MKLVVKAVDRFIDWSADHKVLTILLFVVLIVLAKLLRDLVL